MSQLSINHIKTKFTNEFIVIKNHINYNNLNCKQFTCIHLCSKGIVTPVATAVTNTLFDILKL